MALSDRPNSRPLVIHSHEEAMRLGRDAYERLPEDAKCALNSLMSYEAVSFEQKHGITPPLNMLEQQRNIEALGNSADSLRREYLHNVEGGVLKNRCGVSR